MSKSKKQDRIPPKAGDRIVLRGRYNLGSGIAVAVKSNKWVRCNWDNIPSNPPLDYGRVKPTFCQIHHIDELEIANVALDA